jgi:transcriptional regulator with XRE-family HTH domain
MKEEIGRRLKRALTERGRSIRALQQELEGAGLPGSSYGNVHAYVSGKTQQPLEFLLAAAKVLSVNVAWLAFDVGYITEEEEIIAAAAQAERDLEDHDDVLNTLESSFPVVEPGGSYFHMTSTWSHVLGADFIKRGQAADSKDNHRETARRVGEALYGPIRALGIDPGELSRWQVETYTALVAQAIQTVTLVPSMLAPQRPKED